MSVIEFLQSALGEGWLPFFLGVSRLGDGPIYIFLLSFYFWLVDPQQGRQLSLILTLSIISNFLLKGIFALPRPYVINPDVTTVEAAATVGSFSFPSGHAQGVMTTLGAIAFFQQKRWLWWVAGIFIFLVSLSRMYLGVHFPVDVAAGLILGIFWVTVGSWIGRVERLPQLELAQKFMLWLVGAILAIALPPVAPLIGIFMGFFPVAKIIHQPPKKLSQRLIFSCGGFVLLVIVYTALKILSDIMPISALVDYFRYLAIALTVTELVPWLWRQIITS